MITEFHLSQNPGGKNILEAFRKRIDCGYIKLNHPGNQKDKTWVLIIKNREDIETKLIPFFLKNQFLSKKKDGFTIFYKTINSIKKKEHLNSTGFRRIVELVFSSDRKTKKRYSKQLLLSSETIRKSPIKSDKI